MPQTINVTRPSPELMRACSILAASRMAIVALAAGQQHCTVALVVEG